MNTVEVNRRHARAQQRARQRLVESHRREFARLLREEKDAEGIEPKKVAACGTRAGYARHKRLGEKVDAACRDAARAFWRERNRIRRAS